LRKAFAAKRWRSAATMRGLAFSSIAQPFDKKKATN
jgi:hypothetical protein